MDIKRLQHIVALADQGSFIRAAERVHLSQPAFSRSIQAAEAELEMKLFGRGGGTEVKCTPSGAFVAVNPQPATSCVRPVRCAGSSSTMRTRSGDMVPTLPASGPSCIFRHDIWRMPA